MRERSCGDEVKKKTSRRRTTASATGQRDRRTQPAHSRVFHQSIETLKRAWGNEVAHQGRSGFKRRGGHENAELLLDPTEIGARKDPH